MTSGALLADARTALDALEAAVDQLLDADLGVIDDDGLLQLTRRLEVQRRRLAAVDARVVGEVDARGMGAARGARDTAALLTGLLRVDPGEARARVAAGRDFAARRALTGEVLEPVFPQLAAALQTGVIHPRQAATIARTIERLPVEVQATLDRQIEAELLAEATRFAPFQLAKLCQRLGYLYDQDVTLANDIDRQRRRELNYRRNPDGSMSGQFHLDPTTAEAFETVLDAQLADLTAEQRNSRTPAQLRHDALRDLLFMLLRTGQLPPTAGVTTTLVIHLTWQQWLTVLGEPTARAPGEWLALTNHGAFLTLGEVAPLLGDAHTLPVVLSGAGSARRVEAYGTKHRIFTENQRLALAARDRGCTFPGCTSTPAYCEAHHVTDHAHGGATTIDNGTLLCGYHHRTFATLGYRCLMLDGTPHWIAPTWLDPTQTPQRNTAHDLPPHR